MPILSLILKFVDLPDKVKDLLTDGIDIDQASIDAKAVPVESGSMKNDGVNGIAFECVYQRPGEPKHTIKGLWKEGPNNNELSIDGADLDIVSMQLKPEIHGSFLKPKPELVFHINFRKQGTNDNPRALVLKSERIKF